MKADTKSKIIDSAIILFAEKGYTETSMRDIAMTSGIKAPSIYNHFPGKMDILKHIIDMYSNISQDKIPFITEEYVRENDAGTVLHQFFFKFDDDNSLKYKQIIKIFLQEQYRIDEVRDFMKTQYIENTQKYIKLLLDVMVEYGKINAINTDIAAEILHSINIKSTIASGHYINDPDAAKYDKWGEALDTVIEFIVNA